VPDVAGISRTTRRDVTAQNNSTADAGGNDQTQQVRGSAAGAVVMFGQCGSGSVHGQRGSSARKEGTYRVDQCESGRPFVDVDGGHNTSDGIDRPGAGDSDGVNRASVGDAPQ
jgi:hypothetical protein